MTVPHFSKLEIMSMLHHYVYDNENDDYGDSSFQAAIRTIEKSSWTPYGYNSFWATHLPMTPENEDDFTSYRVRESSVQKWLSRNRWEVMFTVGRIHE